MQIMQVMQVMLVMQVIQVIESYRVHFWWRHLVAKFAAYASSTIWWPNLQLLQVTQPGGPICN